MIFPTHSNKLPHPVTEADSSLPIKPLHRASSSPTPIPNHQHHHQQLPSAHHSSTMRVCSFLILVSTTLLLAFPASASFDCTFTISTHKFDLSPLNGVHTVSRNESTPPSIENTTIFVDLCQDLKWDEKVYPVDDRCKDGTQGMDSLPCLFVLFVALHHS